MSKQRDSVRVCVCNNNEKEAMNLEGIWEEMGEVDRGRTQ